MKFISSYFIFIFTAAVFAAEAGVLSDGIDRSDPNFVKASLVVIGPGNEFFGCAGHSSLRLECPKFKLDNCFTCESEPIRENPLRFVMGDLKMGMFSLPTVDFLKIYEKLGRRATQYPLTLPPDVKQRLWELMDKKVQQGTCLHYDYIRYCCVQTVLMPLMEAIQPYEITFAPWPEKYRLTRREILAENLAWCPWTRFVLHTIAGTEVDEKVSNPKTVILSQDLLDALRGAKVLGKPLIEGEGVVLLPNQRMSEPGFFTPMVAASLLLAVAIGSWFFPVKGTDWFFLALQSGLGLLMTHLLLISNLPATSWNWLIVPFNLLPLVFWKWRRRWALAFAAVLLAWVAGIGLWPHQLTDSAYLVIVLGFVVFYVKVWRSARSADPTRTCGSVGLARRASRNRESSQSQQM